MISQTSLLERVRDTGHEASVIATYNVSFPFYEGVVLPRLRASGCRHNVLLADASMVAQALSDPTTRPALAGRWYTPAANGYISAVQDYLNVRVWESAGFQNG